MVDNKQQQASKEAQASKTVATGVEGLRPVAAQVNDPPAGQPPTPTQAEKMTTVREMRGEPLPDDIEGKWRYLYDEIPADTPDEQTIFGYGNVKITFGDLRRLLAQYFDD